VFAAGVACGVPYHYLAFRTWRNFLEPPQFTGFGPFLLHSAEHVAFASVRSASGLALLVALLLLRGNRRSSGIWALASAAGIVAFELFHLGQAFIDYGPALAYNVSLFEVIDLSCALLVAIGAFLLTRRTHPADRP